MVLVMLSPGVRDRWTQVRTVGDDGGGVVIDGGLLAIIGVMILFILAKRMENEHLC